MRLRRSQGITQDELAKKAGLTRRIIAYYELEENIDFVDKIEKLAKALNVPISELFYYVNGNKQKSGELEPLNPRVFKKISMILELDKADRTKVYEFAEMLLKKEKYKS